MFILQPVILNRAGLILNFLGSVLVAFSIGANLADAHQLDEKGRKVQLASFLHPLWFRLGLLLLAVGFIVQLVSTFI